MADNDTKNYIKRRMELAGFTSGADKTKEFEKEEKN